MLLVPGRRFSRLYDVPGQLTGPPGRLEQVPAGLSGANPGGARGAVSAVSKPVEFTPTVYRMDVPNSGGKEYFLLENRQHIGFDQGLSSMAVPVNPTRIFAAGQGLAIWHIDDTVLTRRRTGVPTRPRTGRNSARKVG